MPAILACSTDVHSEAPAGLVPSEPMHYRLTIVAATCDLGRLAQRAEQLPTVDESLLPAAKGG